MKRVTLRQLAVRVHALLLASAALLAVACEPINPASDGDGDVEYSAGFPTADFDADPTFIPVGGHVQFTNTSSGSVDSILWDFGSAGTSVERNPLVTFARAGEYEVKLTVSGERGADTRVETGAIRVVVPEDAEISCDPSKGVAPLTVTCTANKAGVDHWRWSGSGLADEPDVADDRQSATFSFPGEGAYSVIAEGPGADFFAYGEEEIAALPTKPELYCLMDGDAIEDNVVPEINGLGPLSITCFDESGSGDAVTWRFGDGSEKTAGSPGDSVTHTYTCEDRSDDRERCDDDGPFDICTVGPGGECDGRATQSATVHFPQLLNELSAEPEAGAGEGWERPAAGLATFSVTVGDSGASTVEWRISDTAVELFAGTRGKELTYEFTRAGTYTVAATIQNPKGDEAPETEVQTTYEVSGLYARFHACIAGEDCDPSDAPFGGAGDVVVGFHESSEGPIERWHWDFGDGEGCYFPTVPTDPSPGHEQICQDSAEQESASPSHTYRVEPGTPLADRFFDVTLEVTAPAPPGSIPDTLSSDERKDEYIRIFMTDPGFEEQIAGAGITGDWKALGEGAADHRIYRTRNEDERCDPDDGGMPTQGCQWAMISGEGSDGTNEPTVEDVGITQKFTYTARRSVLLFDFALLYSEPPEFGALDTFVATIDDGSGPEEIPASRFDVRTPISGESTLFSGETPLVAVTIQGTAGIDLSSSYLDEPGESEFDLAFRIANGGGNPNRPPRAYIDNIRFAPRDDAELEAVFETSDPTEQLLPGDAITFENTTCEGASCDGEETWRWDFGVHGTLPSGEATGSSEASPTFTFTQSGSYEVSLTAQRRDRTSVIRETIDLFAPPEASFDYCIVVEVEVDDGVEEQCLASEALDRDITTTDTIRFTPDATSDELDPIVKWIWDLGGFAYRVVDNADPIEDSLVVPGCHPVTLEVETTSGRSAPSDPQTIGVGVGAGVECD